jgi:hypothetical protein
MSMWTWGLLLMGAAVGYQAAVTVHVFRLRSPLRWYQLGWFSLAAAVAVCWLLFGPAVTS